LPEFKFRLSTLHHTLTDGAVPCEGGVSPFWAGSEYRTQRRVIRGIYSMDSANFKDISRSALDCITKLLQVGGRNMKEAIVLLVKGPLEMVHF
jgi:hypothetical protein